MDGVGGMVAVSAHPSSESAAIRILQTNFLTGVSVGISWRRWTFHSSSFLSIALRNPNDLSALMEGDLSSEALFLRKKPVVCDLKLIEGKSWTTCTKSDILFSLASCLLFGLR